MKYLAELDPLLIVGFAGQLLFSLRFLVQWVTSERAGISVVPVAFWYLSLGGGATLLVYAVQRGDPVFILGQGMGLVIYTRNLYLIHRRPRRTRPPSRASRDGLPLATSESAVSPDR